MSAAFALVGAAALAVTAGLALLVAASPAAGLARLSHRPGALPQVMAGRYAGQALLAGIALASRNRGMLLALMICFAMVSLVDTLVYARSGHAYGPHLLAALASAAGALILIAWT